MYRLRVSNRLYLLFLLALASLGILFASSDQDADQLLFSRQQKLAEAKYGHRPINRHLRIHTQEKQEIVSPASRILISESATNYQLDSQPYLEAVKKFADVVIRRGRDVYGIKKTPLFVDGLHRNTYAPVRWQYNGEVWVLSNFANQQTLLRTLDGLTVLTGDKRYRKAAAQTTRYALNHLKTRSGVLNWGGHRAWDLKSEQFIHGPNKAHELKHQQPYFSFMWKVDPAATKQLLRAIWGGHIIDWEKLDFDRHAHVYVLQAPKWEASFKFNTPVPFPTAGKNLSVANTSTPLMHTGVILATRDRNRQVLTWMRRLAYRWQQAEHPVTGLSGGQISFWGGGRDRAYAALGHVHPGINEANLIATYHRDSRYHKMPLAQMQAGEELIAAGGPFAKVGKEFIQWASGDLQAYAQYAYAPEKKWFKSLLTDGTLLQLQDCCRDRYYGRKPGQLKPASSNLKVLWTYATAYRHTREQSHWLMVRNLMKDFKFGDIGTPTGSGRRLRTTTQTSNWRAIYAFLELHYATGDLQFLNLATSVADNILAQMFHNGLFPRGKRQYARTGDEVPLALLHLVAAIEGKQTQMPRIKLDNQYFHSTFTGVKTKNWKNRTYDSAVFYGNT